MGQQGPLGAEKKIFFKNGPRPHAMPKQVFLARFELVVARFGPSKIQNALKMGCFGTTKGSKMGQKCVFRISLIHSNPAFGSPRSRSTMLYVIW